jgi:hypothetical protein
MTEHILTTKRKFFAQRSQARKRGVDWQLSFEQWFAWWGDDYARRGRGSDDLCMSRPGDTGPYALDNIVKKTNKENIQESNCGKVAWNRGMPGAMLGRTLTPEQRQRQSEGLRRWHASKQKEKTL